MRILDAQVADGTMTVDQRIIREMNIQTEEAKGRMGARCVALHDALLKHNITHEYYVGGYGGHDWATWRHLLYYRFLPNLWR